MSSIRVHAGSVVGLSLLLIAGIALLGACKKTPTEKASEKILSDMMSKATGGKAQVDLKKGEIRVKTPDGESVIVGGSTTWPIDLPEDIRKFDEGTIKGATKSERPEGSTWVIIIEGVVEKELTGYVDELKGDGWNVLISTAMEVGTYTQLQKDKWMITLSFNKDEKTLGLNVVHQKEN